MYYREVKVSTETELRWAALYGLAWFVCAMVALQLTEGADGIAAVWPSSGIFVAALLHLNPRGRNMVTACVAVASFAANFSAGAAFTTWCRGHTRIAVQAFGQNSRHGRFTYTSRACKEVSVM